MTHLHVGLVFNECFGESILVSQFEIFTLRWEILVCIYFELSFPPCHVVGYSIISILHRMQIRNWLTFHGHIWCPSNCYQVCSWHPVIQNISTLHEIYLIKIHIDSTRIHMLLYRWTNFNYVKVCGVIWDTYFLVMQIIWFWFINLYIYININIENKKYFHPG